MATTLRRSATVADIVNKLRSDSAYYEMTAIEAMGWGMGNAQEGITDAISRAVKAGTVNIITDKRTHMCGKQYVQLTEWGRNGYQPEPMFTLKYCTDRGLMERVLSAAGVEKVGAVVVRTNASDIEVLDESGADVTFDFECFA